MTTTTTTTPTTTEDNSVIEAHKSLAATGTTSTRFRNSRVSNGNTSNNRTSNSDKGRDGTDNDAWGGQSKSKLAATETISELNFLLQDYMPEGTATRKAVGLTVAAGPEPDKPRITVSRIRRATAGAADVEMCFKFNEIIL